MTRTPNLPPLAWDPTTPSYLYRVPQGATVNRTAIPGLMVIERSDRAALQEWLRLANPQHKG